MLSNPLIYWFSDKIIVLPFHRDLSSVYNRPGMVFVFESWSLCLTIYSHQLCSWEVWWHLTLDHHLSFPCPALTPDSEGLLLPRLHLWPLLSFFFPLLTLRNFLQQHAPWKHLQDWPAHPSLVLTLFELLKIVSLTVSLTWLSENKEIKCIGQTISVIRISKHLNA